jgi:hypothetical protein
LEEPHNEKDGEERVDPPSDRVPNGRNYIYKHKPKIDVEWERALDFPQVPPQEKQQEHNEDQNIVGANARPTYIDQDYFKRENAPNQNRIETVVGRDTKFIGHRVLITLWHIADNPERCTYGEARFFSR